MSPLSREAILAVLSGLTVLGCDKSQPSQATPEPVPSAAAAPAAAAAAAPAGSAPAAPSAAVKEVTPATGKSAEKEMGCAPGACAPGKCGAGK